MTDPGGYTLLFDITRQGYRDGWFPAVGLFFVAVSVAAVVYVRRAVPPRRRGYAIAAWAALVFASVWTLLFGVVTYREQATLMRAVERGAVDHVEGPVENFSPMPADGHGTERFDVGGKHFEYSQNIVTAGFNHTSTTGGPIRSGLHVRVGYVGDVIVRLESR